MLAIRLQRTGRKGHAQFRVVVQDSHRSPKSGKVVAQLGSYNPHTKATAIDKDKASFYLMHGAQPSDRVVLLLKAEGVTLPKWVKSATTKEGKLRNPEKLRANRPAEPEAATKPVETEEVAKAEEVAPVATEETTAESSVEETASEEVATTEDTPEEAPVSEQSPVIEDDPKEIETTEKTETEVGTSEEAKEPQPEEKA